jgi:hypothetical protein
MASSTKNVKSRKRRKGAFVVAVRFPAPDGKQLFEFSTKQAALAFQKDLREEWPGVETLLGTSLDD